MVKSFATSYLYAHYDAKKELSETFKILGIVHYTGLILRLIR